MTESQAPQPGPIGVLARAIDLHEKASMPWTEAERLALSEAGVNDAEIDEVIGESGGLSLLLTTPDDLREFVRSVLVHGSHRISTGPTVDLRAIAEQAGMRVDLLSMGAASMVYSEGCEGVTRAHLERFAALYGFACWNAALAANPPNMQSFVGGALDSLFPAPEGGPALTEPQIDKLLDDLDDAALNFGDDLPGLALNSRGRERSRAIVRAALAAQPQPDQQSQFCPECGEGVTPGMCRRKDQPAPAEGDEPFWHAVVSKRAPVINKAIRRLDVAEEYADKARDNYPDATDIEVVPLYRAQPQPKGTVLADWEAPLRHVHDALTGALRRSTQEREPRLRAAIAEVDAMLAAVPAAQAPAPAPVDGPADGRAQFDVWYADYHSKLRPWSGTRECQFAAWQAARALQAPAVGDEQS